MPTIHATEIEQPFHIAIVVSRFNEAVTQALYEGAMERLKELGFDNDHITVSWVPGAVELPLVAQQFAKQDKYAAVITIGAVIRGETDHYDYVCQQVSYGVQRLALDFEKPIIFCVLTTDNQAQAMDRCGGKHGHKGRDAADAAYEMVSVCRQIA